MKSNVRKLHLATTFEEPSPACSSLFGAEAVATASDERRAHRAAFDGFLRSASALAKHPELTTKPQRLAIHQAIAAVMTSRAACDAAHDLERAVTQHAGG